jgi:hypothetical protein
MAGKDKYYKINNQHEVAQISRGTYIKAGFVHLYF